LYSSHWSFEFFSFILIIGCDSHEQKAPGFLWEQLPGLQKHFEFSVFHPLLLGMLRYNHPGSVLGYEQGQKLWPGELVRRIKLFQSNKCKAASSLALYILLDLNNQFSVLVFSLVLLRQLYHDYILITWYTWASYSSASVSKLQISKLVRTNRVCYFLFHHMYISWCNLLLYNVTLDSFHNTESENHFDLNSILRCSLFSSLLFFIHSFLFFIHNHHSSDSIMVSEQN
jgi:hypothetical protein